MTFLIPAIHKQVQKIDKEVKNKMIIVTEAVVLKRIK
jgi:hypothetical protein